VYIRTAKNKRKKTLQKYGNYAKIIRRRINDAIGKIIHKENLRDI
jgi:hypothetical protein